MAELEEIKRILESISRAQDVRSEFERDAIRLLCIAARRNTTIFDDDTEIAEIWRRWFND